MLWAAGRRCTHLCMRPTAPPPALLVVLDMSLQKQVHFRCCQGRRMPRNRWVTLREGLATCTLIRRKPMRLGRCCSCLSTVLPEENNTRVLAIDGNHLPNVVGA
mmetsp:Transcript_50825/g.128187  ORF Transcript_50825/g.128187 Transcript_50825/m.128187 type:complete len:104 (+) Transcript_50825:913-1224(+)